VDSVRVFGVFVYQALTLARSSIATAAGWGLTRALRQSLIKAELELRGCRGGLNGDGGGL